MRRLLHHSSFTLSLLLLLTAQCIGGSKPSDGKKLASRALVFESSVVANTLKNPKLHGSNPSSGLADQPIIKEASNPQLRPRDEHSRDGQSSEDASANSESYIPENTARNRHLAASFAPKKNTKRDYCIPAYSQITCNPKLPHGGCCEGSDCAYDGSSLKCYKYLPTKTPSGQPGKHFLVPSHTDIKRIKPRSAESCVGKGQQCDSDSHCCGGKLCVLSSVDDKPRCRSVNIKRSQDNASTPPTTQRKGCGEFKDSCSSSAPCCQGFICDAKEKTCRYQSAEDFWVQAKLEDYLKSNKDSKSHGDKHSNTPSHGQDHHASHDDHHGGFSFDKYNSSSDHPMDRGSGHHDSEYHHDSFSRDHDRDRHRYYDHHGREYRPRVYHETPHRYPQYRNGEYRHSSHRYPDSRERHYRRPDGREMRHEDPRYRYEWRPVRTDYHQRYRHDGRPYRVSFDDEYLHWRPHEYVDQHGNKRPSSSQDEANVREIEDTMSRLRKMIDDYDRKHGNTSKEPHHYEESTKEAHHEDVKKTHDHNIKPSGHLDTPHISTSNHPLLIITATIDDHGNIRIISLNQVEGKSREDADELMKDIKDHLASQKAHGGKLDDSSDEEGSEREEESEPENSEVEDSDADLSESDEGYQSENEGDDEEENGVSFEDGSDDDRLENASDSEAEYEDSDREEESDKEGDSGHYHGSDHEDSDRGHESDGGHGYDEESDDEHGDFGRSHGNDAHEEHRGDSHNNNDYHNGPDSDFFRNDKSHPGHGRHDGPDFDFFGHDNSHHEYSHHENSHNEDSHHEGNHHEDSHHEGNHHEDNHHEVNHHEDSHDEGSHHEEHSSNVDSHQGVHNYEDLARFFGADGEDRMETGEETWRRYENDHHDESHAISEPAQTEIRRKEKRSPRERPDLKLFRRYDMIKKCHQAGDKCKRDEQCCHNLDCQREKETDKYGRCKNMTW